MGRRLVVVFATAAALATASGPARAQGGGVRGNPHSGARVHAHGAPTHFNHHGFNHQGFNHHRFARHPISHHRFPVFGLGFDAHHFSALNRHHGRFIQPGFFGGAFFGNNFFTGGFFPFVSSSSTLVVVPQAIPVQVPVEVPVFVPDTRPVVEDFGSYPAPPGLPWNWSQVRVVKPSYPVERPPLKQLTLLVLRDEIILAVTDYWLEDGRVFFVTSSGAQYSVAVRDLDLEMTTRLNAERHVAFILRNPR